MNVRSKQAWWAVLAASITLNLCLFILLFSAPNDPPAANQIAAARSILPKQRTMRPMLRWSDIESDDQDGFAANLRAIGCPDNFIHNAIVAEINRKYEEKRWEIGRISNFWQTHDAHRAEAYEREGELIRLDEQWRQEIEAAIGKPAALAPRMNWPGHKQAAVRAVRFGFLAPGQLEQAAALFDDAEQLRARLTHLFDGETEADLLARRQHYHQEFQANTRALLNESQLGLLETFQYEVYLFDVWKSKTQFGRDLSSEEERAATEILMPPDYLSHYLFKLPLASIHDEALVAERESQLRNHLGDEAVEHYREFNKAHTPQNMVFPKP